MKMRQWPYVQLPPHPCPCAPDVPLLYNNYPIMDLGFQLINGYPCTWLTLNHFPSSRNYVCLIHAFGNEVALEKILSHFYQGGHHLQSLGVSIPSFRGHKPHPHGVSIPNFIAATSPPTFT